MIIYNPTTSLTMLDVISRSEATRNLIIKQVVKDSSLTRRKRLRCTLVGMTSVVVVINTSQQPI